MIFYTFTYDVVTIDMVCYIVNILLFLVSKIFHKKNGERIPQLTVFLNGIFLMCLQKGV